LPDIAGQDREDRLALGGARPIRDERLRRSVAFMQGAGEVIGKGEIEAVEALVPEVALFNMHTVQALAERLRRGHADRVAGAMRDAVAVLEVLSFESPVGHDLPPVPRAGVRRDVRSL